MIVILTSHLHLGVENDLIPWGFTIKLCALLSHASLTNLTPVGYKSWISSLCDFSCLKLIPLATARYRQTPSLQGQLAHKGCSVASFPEISRKIKMNTWIKNFVRRYAVHSLKNMTEIILNSNTRDWLQALRRTEKRTGCALPRSCALASAQLRGVVPGKTIECFKEDFNISAYLF